MIYTKHYELSEAREVLISLIPVLKKISELKRILDSKNISEEKYFFMGKIGKNGDGEYPQEMYEITKLISLIMSKEIQIKNLDYGLIDFPHIKKTGEEVFLCYELGESTIEFWHGLEEGYAGRKSVNLL
ncbi:MAG: DUF2203 family protein [Ignavibacteria bacterium]|nr:DUF2203 family protein [Ignavibacteria bacterium]